MSFKAPIERHHSRLEMSWRMLLDPPQLSRGLSIGLCGINVVLPGVGTMITGIISDTMEVFLVGALQLMLAIVILGWVWSVAWGVELVHRSVRRGIGAEGCGEEGLSDWEISPQQAHAGVEGEINASEAATEAV